MVSSTAEAQAVERVARTCRTHDGDAMALRLALLDQIRAVVAFEAYAWLLTDPQTEVGSAPLADVPCIEHLPRLIGLKYLTAVNRWTTLDRPVSRLRAATHDRRQESLVWRELLSQHDVDDVASMVFRDGFGCWAFLDLWRIGAGPAFTEAESRFLARIAEPVTTALRRCQARTLDLAGPVRPRTGPAVLVLGPTLAVRAQTPETAGFLRLLVPTDGDRSPVPAGAYNVAAQLVAVESGVDRHPPRARVHLAGGTWLALRAARMGGSPPTGDQDIAVTIEPTSPAERLDLYVRAFGLSRREAELLGHLASGADTTAVAAAMCISPLTVQDHLKSVFAKTGARNRRTLLARVAGR